MKKLIIIIFCLCSINTFAQYTIEQRAGFHNSGEVGAVYNDTVVIAPYIANYFVNGNLRFQKFDSTVKSNIGIGSSYTNNGLFYANSTSTISQVAVPGHAGMKLGWNGSSYVWQDTTIVGTGGVQGDTSLVVITANNLFQFNPYGSTRQVGLQLKNNVLATSGVPYQYPPSIMMKGSQYSGGTNITYYTAIRGTQIAAYGTSGILITTSTDSTSQGTAMLTLNGYDGLKTPYIGQFGGEVTAPIFTSPVFRGTKGYLNAGTGQLFMGVNSYQYDQLSSVRGIGNFGITPNNLSTVNRFQVTNGIMTMAIVNGGTGGTNGSYANIPTVVSGVGTTTANLNYIISGGVITSVSNPSIPNIGNNFYIGDTIAINQHGLTGTKIVVRSIYGQSACGVMMTDTTTGINKLYRFDCGLKKQVPLLDSQVVSGNLTTSNAGTLTLVAGNDYIFTGTTATYTLPAISTTAIGRSNIIYIKNAGSGSITLNSASGSTIYTSSAQSTLAIAAGDGIALLPDGTYYNVMFNNAIL